MLGVDIICDAVHEKVQNGENGVIRTGVSDMCQGIKQNNNQGKILSSFRDIDFLLKKLKPENLLKNSTKLIFNILPKM